MPKRPFVNKKTGETAWFDVDESNGKPIPTTEGTSRDVRNFGTPESTIEAISPEKKFYSNIGRYLPMALAAGGATIGQDLIPIPGVGAAIGSGTGTVMANVFKKYLPQYFGQYNKDEYVNELATNVALD